MDPRAVVCLVQSETGVFEPFPIVPFNNIAVSPPIAPGVDGSNLSSLQNNQVLIVSAISPMFVFAQIPPALLTASAMFSQGFGSGNLYSAVGVDTTVDAFPGAQGSLGTPDGPSVLTMDQLYAWNGGAYDRVRIANVFHTALVTAAGTTAVWTPTAGTRFRLMGYSIDIAGTAAATGVQAIELLDGATVIKNHLAVVLQTFAATTAIQGVTISVDCGQGQLSAAANNVLNIHTSEAMVSGGVAINVWGTEE